MKRALVLAERTQEATKQKQRMLSLKKKKKNNDYQGSMFDTTDRQPNWHPWQTRYTQRILPILLAIVC